MNVLSAADAISPAIERTKWFLFQPFDWRTYLKLCAVAVLTEGFASGFSASSPGKSAHHPVAISGVRLTPSPAMIAAVVACVLAAIVISLVVLYLITRLRFALFHCLVHRTKEIGPGWHLYGEQAGRFFLLNIVIWLGFISAAAAVALPFVLRFIALYRASAPGHHFNVFAYLALFLPFIALILCLALLGVITDLILRDFILPHYALESASAGEAWARVRQHLEAERGSFLLYGLFRIVIPAVTFTVLLMALAIPGLILFGTLGLIFVGVHSMSAGATGVSALVGILFQILIGLIGAGLALFLAVSFGGPLCIGIRNYALIFYGSRYPALGDALYPSPPPGLLDSTTTS
jgi:hypothetical protein